jgi:hypothetical protein
MKTRRINLTNNPEKDDICHSLSETFKDKSEMKDLKAVYDANRRSQESELYKNDHNLRYIVKISDSEIAWKWFLNMSMGIKEAAYYLAVSFLEGYGVKENETLMNVCLAIGTKLNDPQTIEYIGSEKIPSKALKVADKCITLINYAAKAVQGKEITYEEAVGWGKCLDRIVLKKTLHSFESNIHDSAFKMAGDKYVEVVEGPIGLIGEDGCVLC